MKKLLLTFSISFILLFNYEAMAHCEIPCGIYEDSVRIALLYEHITTIEKSMNMITKLQAEETNVDYNQLLRWIMNKEEHANKIQYIVAQYFMHQRVKPVSDTNNEKYEVYIKQLTLLHAIQIFAMKAKQTTNLDYIEKLNTSVQNFEQAYFIKHKH